MCYMQINNTTPNDVKTQKDLPVSSTNLSRCSYAFSFPNTTHMTFVMVLVH